MHDYVTTPGAIAFANFKLRYYQGKMAANRPHQSVDAIVVHIVNLMKRTI